MIKITILGGFKYRIDAESSHPQELLISFLKKNDVDPAECEILDDTNGHAWTEVQLKERKAWIK